MKITAQLEFSVEDGVDAATLLEILDAIRDQLRAAGVLARPFDVVGLPDADIPAFRIEAGEWVWRPDRKGN